MNACTVTLAIVTVERCVSVHADDVGVGSMRLLLKMHMLLVAVCNMTSILEVEPYADIFIVLLCMQK